MLHHKSYLCQERTTKTPYELWKGKTLNFSYFRVFGCNCYILNNKDHLGKFDAWSDEGMFLGRPVQIEKSDIREVWSKSQILKLCYYPPDVNYVKSIQEYLHQNNTDIGFHHLHLATKSSYVNATKGSYLNAFYLYGIPMLCRGELDIGKYI